MDGDNKETTHTHNDHTSAQKQNNSLMAAIAYVGPLVILSYLIAKDEPFVKFHIKQGLVLFVIEVAIWVLSMILWFLFPLYWLIDLAILVLSIIGIINAVQGKEKALPFVGGYSKHFKI